MSKDIALPEGVTLAATSLTFPKTLTLEKWIDCGEALSRIGGAVQWWLGDWWNGGKPYGDRVVVVRDLEMDHDAIRVYAFVAAHVLIRINTLSWGHHQVVASLEAEEQVEWLRRAEKGDGEKPWTIAELRKALFLDKLKKRHEAIAGREKAEPEKREYPLIYADPPWKFSTYSELGKEMTSPDLHYPTLETDDIGALNVWGRTIPELAFKDAGLFLWCTSANFKKALEVVEAWGFEYKTHAVWDKQRTGTGYIFMNQHEPLIYASRGNFPMPLKKFPSVLSYKRGKHSEKPAEVRQALERMYPKFTENDRIELFARGDIPGWTTWGNEAE